MKSINEKNKKKIILFLIVSIFFLVIYLLPKKQLDYLDQKSYIKNPRMITNTSTLKIAVEKKDNSDLFFDKAQNKHLLASKLTNPSLFYKDKNNNVINEIAEEYWYEDSGKTISIVLRDDFKFDDEKKLTTKHVLNTYKTLLDPSYKGNDIYVLENLKGFYNYKLKLSKEIDGIEVLGDKFIKFHFNTPSLSNIHALMYPIRNISDKDYKYNDLSNIDDKIAFDGAGRYYIDEFSDSYIRLRLKNNTRNKDIDLRVIEIYYMNYRDALNKFNSGELDMLYKYPRTKDLNEYLSQRMSEYSYTIDNQSNTYNFIGFNDESRLFSKQKYRRALRNSIDIKSIVDREVGKGVYDYPSLPVYENSWFSDEKIDFKTNINLEDELKKEFRKEDKIFKDSNGNDLEIKLIYLEDDIFSKSIIDSLVTSIERNGVKVRPEAVDSTKMYEVLNGEGDFDIFISRRKLNDLPIYKYESNYVDKKEYTISNLVDEDFFYILDALEKDNKDEKLKKLAEDWQRSFEVTSPYIVLSSENMVSVVNKRIKNIYFNEFVGLEDVENLTKIEFGDM